MSSNQYRIVLEIYGIAHHYSRGLGQLMGVARKRTRDQALHTSRKKAVELT